MTPDQIYQKYNEQYHLEGNNGGIQKHKRYILEMMKEFGKLMCDKQKEICSIEAETKDDSNPHSYESYYVVDTQSILNAPYPEEIQNLT